MIKKTASFITLICMLALVACGAPPTSSGVDTSGQSSATNRSSEKASSENLSWDNPNAASLKGQTITVLWTKAGPAQEELTKSFTDKTGIQVKNIFVNYDSVYNKITTSSMASSSDIDVNELNYIWTGNFFAGKVDVELTDVVPKEVQDQWTKGAHDAMQWQGHLMGVPWYTSSKHFYWNTKILKEAGVDQPPKSWDEFREVSKKIQEKLGSKGVFASGWSWKQADSLLCDFTSILGSYGGTFYDENNKPVFNSDAGVKALTLMVDLINADKTVDPSSLQWSESDVTKMFATGKLAMMSNWEGQFAALNDPENSTVVGQTDVGVMPGTGDIVSSATVGSEGLAIMKNSQHKEAALEFLKYLVSKEFQLKQFKEIGFYPSVQSFYSDPEFAVQSDKVEPLDKMLKQYDYTIPLPSAPGAVKDFDAIEAHIYKALLHKETPKEALDNAVKELGKGK